MSLIPFIWGGLATVVLTAALLGRRGYGLFIGVFLGILAGIWTALFPRVSGAELVIPAFIFLVYAHFVRLIRPAMPAGAYRWLVGIPASVFTAGTMLALPWAVVAAFGVTPYGWWIPFAIALLGLGQSLLNREEEVDIVIDRTPVSGLMRQPHGDARTERPLRIVQISDPHLGMFMSEARLRGLCERAVARDPDLILLTGDFLTWESQQDDAARLTRALAPLEAMRGRVFACRGNHDLEAPHIVAAACAAVGVELLLDAEAVVDTPAGRVQIVGIDYRWRGRQRHLAEVCAAHPRRPDAFRIVLLHDPGAFTRLPEGEGDLVLSGHTHGGQVGLVSLGLRWTFAHAVAGIPDHGYWARGTDRLYVHRGSGHYGFPLRVGVPAEESLLRIHRPTNPYRG